MKKKDTEKNVLPDVAVAGAGGTAKVGKAGVALAGKRGHAYGEQVAVSFVHDNGVAKTKDGGVSVALNYGTAEADFYAVAVSHRGKSIVGEKSIAIGWKLSTVKAGAGSVIIISTEDYSVIKVGRIGEDGLEPNVEYKLEKVGQEYKFVKVE